MFLTNAPLGRGISKWASSKSVQTQTAMQVGPFRELPDRSNHGNSPGMRRRRRPAPPGSLRWLPWRLPVFTVVAGWSSLHLPQRWMEGRGTRASRSGTWRSRPSEIQRLLWNKHTCGCGTRLVILQSFNSTAPEHVRQSPCCSRGGNNFQGSFFATLADLLCNLSLRVSIRASVAIRHTVLTTCVRVFVYTRSNLFGRRPC